MAFFKFTANDDLTYTIPFSVDKGATVYLMEGDSGEIYNDYVVDDNTVDITFASNVSGKTFIVTRLLEPTPPVAYQEGDDRSAQAINNENTANYNVQDDLYHATVNRLTYYLSGEDNLYDEDGKLPDNLLSLPIPPDRVTTPILPKALCWNGVRYIFENLEQSGSAGELKLELAQPPYNNVSGADLISYTFINGSDVLTVRGALDEIFKPATGVTNSGATSIPAWNPQGNPTTVQDVVTALLSTAIGISDSAANNIPAYNGSGSNATTVQEMLNNMRYYGIGDYIAGVPTHHPYGEWIQVNADHSIGSAASGATHASDDYEALYLYIRQQYLGESEATAQASWTANTAITPGALASNPIPGTNSWRYGG